MEQKKAVFIVSNYGDEYTAMFEKEGWTVVDDMEWADILQFTGGSDVSPHLYGHHAHIATQSNQGRDEYEKLIYLAALKKGIPMAGICRGSQFLNVMNGGTMWQDVTKHCGAHHATYRESERVYKMIKVSSTHHQMMKPPDMEVGVEPAYDILMTANNGGKKTCANSLAEKAVFSTYTAHGRDIEAVYYKDTACLCYQPHPEFEHQNIQRKLYFEWIDKYLLAEGET